MKIINNFSTIALAIMMAIIVNSCTESPGSDLNTNLLPVKVGEKWGYVNQKGEYIINPQFDMASPFLEGRACVLVNDKFGFIDEKGTYVVHPKYKEATFFSEGRAWVVEEGKAPTLIDKDGKELFDMKEIECAYPFFDGLAQVRVAGDDGSSLYGYINKKGEYVVNPRYTSAENFSDGMAAVSGKDRNGYINKVGKVMVNDTVFKYREYFHNGHAIVGIDDKDWITTYGVIDKSGKYVINPQFRRIENGGYGFLVKNDDGQWGLCDNKGKYVINPQFDGILSFGNSDFAPVAIGEKWGYIDKKGKLVINPQFDSAFPFIDNNIAVVSIGNKTGFIDKEGKYTVNPQFTDFSLSFYTAYLIGSQEIFSYVESDYFDAEAAVDLIVKNVNEKGVHGLAPGVSIDKLLKKIGKDESVLNRYYCSLQELYNRSLGSSMNVQLEVQDNDFFNTVSDGWWGYERVYNPKAKVNNFHYIIEMKGRGVGKQDQLIKALKRRFNVKDDGITGRIGKFDVDIIEMGDGVDIMVYNDSKKKDEVTEEVEGEYVGEGDEGSINSENVETAFSSDLTTYNFTGSLNYKYDIKMTLSKSDDDLSGSYYYTSKNIPISLKGTIRNGSIKLTETTDGKSTGYFDGTLNGNEISGTWTSADGKSRMPFKVSM